VTSYSLLYLPEISFHAGFLKPKDPQIWFKRRPSMTAWQSACGTHGAPMPNPRQRQTQRYWKGSSVDDVQLNCAHCVSQQLPVLAMMTCLGWELGGCPRII
jgi:hypothetical protein